jgi:NADPH-dependent curcumin reductase CurA
LGSEVTESEFVNRRIVLARRPAGAITRDDFTIETFELQDVPTGHLVLRVILIQIAPAARAVMTNTTPFPQTAVGDGILCAVVGEVVASPAGGPPLGSLRSGYGLWEDYAVVPVVETLPVVPGRPLTDNLGPLGLNGLTAYFGMTRLGAPRPNETVVVSAAAGGVGHLAGQLARAAGARVLGITGSAEKNHRLQSDYGFDATVNHRSANFQADLIAAAPAAGIDVFFDNVGGSVLDAVLPLMARRGRIVCCGAVSQYDHDVDNVDQPGPRGVPQRLINKSLRMEGFEVADFQTEWGEAIDVLRGQLETGSLRQAVHLWHGLESAPDALTALLTGRNFGQGIVRLRPDSQ